jgi:hypothetical protein
MVPGPRACIGLPFGSPSPSTQPKFRVNIDLIIRSGAGEVALP